jgi:hypothetical protein
METLAEDLILLSLNPANGRVVNPQRILYGIMGAELVRLAAYGRVDIVVDQVMVRDENSTGDPLLDYALARLAASGPVSAGKFVRQARTDLYNLYVQRLVDEGAIRQQMFKYARILTVPGFAINDPGRVSAARARLDAVALSDEPVTAEQAALGGLAVAIALDQHLYPGWGGRKARKRLDRVARGEVAAAAVADAAQAGVRRAADQDQPLPDFIPPLPPDQNDQQQHPGHHHQVHPVQGASTAMHAAGAAGQAATHAATSAATNAATHAAMQAATHAATQAAVHAATHAAVAAAHSAASSAASHSGGGGHHGGGGGGGGDHGGGGGHHH